MMANVAKVAVGQQPGGAAPDVVNSLLLNVILITCLFI